MVAAELTVYSLQVWPKGRYTRYRARKACMRNAWLVAVDHPELALVKGYVRLADCECMWIGHWWCVDADNRVVDPTLKNSGLAYIGVETVDLVALSARIAEDGYIDLELPTIAPPDVAVALERAAGASTERPLAGR